MSYLVGVLIILVGLLVSIGLHEIGHLVPAKKFGVRVPQYMIGFGPTLWSFRRGETEYGIKAIPLGGYVRLVGMYAPDDPRKTAKKGRLAEFIQSARDASTEEILPGEESRAFYNLSAPKKFIVMFAGPFMNLIIAFVVLSFLFVAFGTPQLNTTLSTVAQCVLPAQSAADAQCDTTTPAAPAAEAGLEPGDTIVAWDGTDIESWQQLTELIAASGGKTVTVEYERDGTVRETMATPLTVERPVFDENGVAVVAEDGTAVTHMIGHMGFSGSREFVPRPVTEVPGEIGKRLAATAQVIVSLPQRLVDVAQAAFGNEERDPNSVVGIVGIGRFAGEISSSEQLRDAGFTVPTLLGLVAQLNIALFAFNMIPLPPLDGGHIASALYEGSRRQIARLRNKPRPGPVDTAKLLPLTYTMFFILLGMGVLLIYADIVNPIKLFS
ncbi:M50 family metallopeptidase [Timonella sp. A28]|uniref:M50 family metallopeptidase n=1 Tax=Timonella sp. A28 TaxID=3442640 RepID=UPI003EC0BE93